MDIAKLYNVTTVTIGSSAVFAVVISTPPGSTWNYTLEVTTTSGKSTICDIRVSHGGSNVPCISDAGLAEYFSLDGNVTYYKAVKEVGLAPNSAPFDADISSEDEVSHN